MALLLAELTLASGITVINPCLAITQLATNNSINTTESLNDDNQIISVDGGMHSCNFQLGVFANEQAVIDKLPPIDVVREGRHVKVYQIRLDDETYNAITPREAAYTYLKTLTEYSEATDSTQVLV